MLRRSPSSHARLFSLASASLAGVLLSVVTGSAQPINSPTNAMGTVGLPFSYQISTTNSATNYSATPLPPGLVAPGTNGLITGLPQAVGLFTSTVTAVSTNATNSTNVAITINPPAAPVLVSPLTFFGMQGEPLRFALLSDPGHSNVPTIFSASNLPAGATLISNVTTNALYTNVLVTNYFINAASLATNGSFVVPVVTRNAGGTNTNNVTFVISPSTAPVITSTNVASGIVGVPFSFDVTAINNPLRFRVTSINGGPAVSITNGALTNGLSFSNVSSGSYVVGRIFGTPATTNTVTLGLEAINNTLTSATQTLTINIGPPQPTVILSQPLGEANFAAGSSFYVNAQAFDRLPDTIVPSSVSFTADGAALPGVIGRLGEFYGVEFFPNSGLPFPFNLEVTAQNSLGQTSSFALPMRQWTPANTFPVIQMLPLLPGPQIQAGGVATLRARASTPSARTVVDRVEFYVNKVFVGSSSTVVAGTVDEYQFQWQTPATAGAFEVSARVISQNGNGTLPPIPPGTVVPVYASVITRAPVVLNTAPGVLPTVGIIAPTSGAQLPLNVATRVVASANVFGGSVQQVQFYVDGRPLGAADTTAPYSVDFTPTSYGTYQLFAIATSSAGLINISPTVTVTVPELQGGNPTVTLNAPTSAKTGEVLTFTADANDSDGTIASVQFLANGAPLPTPDAAGNANPNLATPYRYVFAPGAPGRYELIARATDNSGNVTDSKPVVLTVTVGAPPAVSLAASSAAGAFAPPALSIADGGANFIFTFSIRSGLSYTLQQTASLSTPWTASAFTPVDDIDQSGVPDGFVRKRFVVPKSPTLFFRVLYSGILSYALNGTAVFTANASDTDGSIRQVDLVVNGVVVASLPAGPYRFNYQFTAPGLYKVVARATDNFGNISDSDAVTVDVTQAAPPTVSLTTPLAADTLTPGIPVSIVADVEGKSGTISLVEFFVNGVNVGSAVAQPFLVSYTPPAVGPYEIFARATDSLGNVTDSARRLVNAIAPAGAQPLVVLNQPLSGSRFVAGSSIFLNATGTKADGSVDPGMSMKFLVNGIDQAGVSANTNSGQFSVPFNLTQAGTTYSVQAVARQTDGVQGAAAPVNVATLGAQNPFPQVEILDLVPGTPTTAGGTIPLRARAQLFGADPAQTKVQFFADGWYLGDAILQTDGTYLLNWITPNVAKSYSQVKARVVAPNATVSTGGGGGGQQQQIVYFASVFSSNFLTINTASGVRPSATMLLPVDGSSAGLNQALTLRAAAGGSPGVASVTINDGGSGYTSAPTVSVTNPGITSIIVSNGGSGYTSAPTVGFTGGGGTGAVAVAVLGTGASAGKVVRVDVTNPGTGYSSAPSVAFSGGGGSGAVAAAIVDPASGVAVLGTGANAGKVVRVDMTNAGGGYATVPTVTFSGGGGSGAVATANVRTPSIASVQFYGNGTPIGAPVTGQPYETTYTPTSQGTYVFAAVATSTDGLKSLPDSVVVAISSGEAPQVRVVNPESSAKYPPGMTIPISATATPKAPGSRIVSIQFFVDGVSLGLPDTQAPFLGQFLVPGEGPFKITALATDNFGNVGVGTVSIEGQEQPAGQAAFINMTHPVPDGLVDGFNDFSSASELYLNASVALPTNVTVTNISDVKFLLDGEVLAGAIAQFGNSYAIYWRPSSINTNNFGYAINAQVKTSTGITIVSPALGFVVGELSRPLPTISMLPLASDKIRQGSATYLQAVVNGGLQPVDRVDFYANKVFIGSVPLFTADANENVLAVLPWTPPASDPGGFAITARALQVAGYDNSVISTNSRTLVVEGPASGLEPVVTLAQAPIAERNYVTGSELFLNATAVAQGSATIDTNSIQFFYRGQPLTRTNGVESSGVLAGANIVYTARVPVQSDALANFVYASAKDSINNLGNSDFSQINPAAPRKAFPTVQMLPKLPGQPEVAGGFVTLRAEAAFPAGSDSQGQRVEFYANGAFVGVGTNSTAQPNVFSLQWKTPSAINAFEVNARALDLNFTTPGGQGAPEVEYYSSVISTVPVAVNTIVGSNPVVSVTFPANNAEVPVNVPTFIRANASVSGSNIKEVRFYADGTQVGEPDASAPYEVAFTPTSPGLYEVYAIAETISGVIGVSAPAVVVSAVQGRAPTSFLKTSTSATAMASVNTNTKVVTGFTNLVGGSGYVTNLAPEVRLVGGTTNTISRVTASVGAPGSVTNLSIVNAGAGYTNVPTVVIDPPPVTVGTNASVLLQASAADSDGTISRVEFLQNGVVVGTTTNSPYNFTLPVTAIGSYQLVARAVDNLGNVTDSPYIVLLARGGAAPVVSITDPVNGASVTPGVPVTVTANASDSDGSVARVELLVNGVVVGTDTQAPYVFTDAGQFSSDTNTTFTPPSEGQYVVVARAVDNAGNVTDSTPVTVTATPPPVGAPTVQMTQPLGEIYYVDGSSYFLNARITDTPPGTINTNSVKFTVNGLPVTGSPLGRIGNDYGVRYRPINLFGIDAARAEALDNEGNRGISQPNYTVLTIPQYPLPAVKMLPLLPNTPTNAGGKITLRAEAFFPSTASQESRVEFYANNVYVGTASNDPTDGAAFLYDWTTPTNQASYVVQARAVARNFQTAVGEGNVIRFFGSIISENATAVNMIPGVPPTVSIFQPTNNQTVNVNQAFNIRANATNPAGTIGRVEFYANGQLIGVDTNAVYEANFTPPSTGLYNLAAIAYTQSGILAVSDTVTVNSALGAPPVVTITAPATAAVGGNPVTLSAGATPVGAGRNITSVEFVVNNIVVATDTTYPYQYEWPVLSPGNYQIWARAIDNVGNIGLSPVTTLTTFYAPIVTLTPSATNVRQGETVRLRARAFTDEPGQTITNVRFVNANGTPLPSPGANGGPNPVAVPNAQGFYDYFYAASQPGTISLQAIATDTAGNEGESSLVEITVAADASAPIINITSPVTGSQIQLNVPLAITAAASPGQDATITSVQFRVTNPDGVITTLTPTQTNSPFSVSYTGVTKPGFYNITAQVLNSAGKSNVSNVVVEAILVPPPAPGTNLAFIRDMFLLLFYRLPTENERDYWYDWLGATSETELSPLPKRAEMVMELMGFDTSAQTFVNTSGFWTPPVASYQATSAMALQPFGRLGITPTKTLVENFLTPLAADVALNPPDGRPLPLTGTYSFIPDAPYGATYGMAAGMQNIFTSPQFTAVYPNILSLGNAQFVGWLREVMFAGRAVGDVLQVSAMMDAFSPQSQRQGAGGAFLTKFVVRQAASFGYLNPASAAAERAFQLKLNTASLKFQLNDSASAFWNYDAAPDYSKPVVELYIDQYWDAKQ